MQIFLRYKNTDYLQLKKKEEEKCEHVEAALTIKLRSPVRMVETDQAGFHVSGWKSLILRHSLKQTTIISARLD
jgi:hypothetical protein